MISTILLLPHAATRERLLAPGAPVYDDVCRAYGWTIPGGWTTGEDVEHYDAPPLSRTLDVDGDCHLVLARDGAVVPEGVDRLARVSGEPRTDIEDDTTDILEARTDGMMRRRAISYLVRHVASLGELVLLDAAGEVPDV